jgi:hypothetical protein
MRSYLIRRQSETASSVTPGSNRAAWGGEETHRGLSTFDKTCHRALDAGRAKHRLEPGAGLPGFL